MTTKKVIEVKKNTTGLDSKNFTIFDVNGDDHILISHHELALKIEILKHNPYHSETFNELCALLRINILAGLCSAGHGWLGASFSSLEPLVSIYLDYIRTPQERVSSRAGLIISKGHASLAIYAILGAFGVIPCQKILDYQLADGLPAHLELKTPGVDSGSGCLGWGLSKANGLGASHIRSNRRLKVFTLLGDGEFQEGQVFESLLSFSKFNNPNVLPIVDANALQSDSLLKDIKDIDNWQMFFLSIGIRPFVVNGESFISIKRGIKEALDFKGPAIVVCETYKGQGTEITKMDLDTPLGQGVWHGKVPDYEEYRLMLKELSIKSGSSEIITAVQSLKSHKKIVKSEKDNLISTGQAFGKSICTIADKKRNITLLDADLRKSCRLTEFSEKFPKSFFEMGISEQDMLSTASGLALGGALPVTNTYAAFYRRAADQIYGCVLDGQPIVLAGHYAGVDYFSDGPTHQCLHDIALMNTLGLKCIYEPVFHDDITSIFNSVLDFFSLNKKSGPAYIRLHRTPADIDKKDYTNISVHSYELKSSADTGPCSLLVATSCPHMIHSLQAVSKKLAHNKRAHRIAAFSRIKPLDKKTLEYLSKFKKIIFVENHVESGGAGDIIAGQIKKYVHKIGADKPINCFRSLEDSLKYQGLDAETLFARIETFLK